MSWSPHSKPCIFAKSIKNIPVWSCIILNFLAKCQTTMLVDNGSSVYLVIALHCATATVTWVILTTQMIEFHCSNTVLWYCQAMQDLQKFLTSFRSHPHPFNSIIEAEQRRTYQLHVSKIEIGWLITDLTTITQHWYYVAESRGGWSDCDQQLENSLFVETKQ